MRVIVTAGTLILCTSSIVYFFWQQELKYVLPTPVPAAYVPVLFKQPIDLPAEITAPVFIHFFNPACPCSRFNQKHVNQLIFQYGNKIKFKVVIPPYASVQEARTFFDDDIEIILDTHGWARRCGVYSTPQAVIIDQQSNLYFRGNYNRTRYCTDPHTNYAEHALKAFAAGEALPLEALDASAQRAYGCSFTEGE
jgi:hypothetical protein